MGNVDVEEEEERIIYDNCPINISIGSDLGTSLVYVSILLISDPYISPLVSWVCTYTS